MTTANASSISKAIFSKIHDGHISRKNTAMAYPSRLSSLFGADPVRPIGRGETIAIHAPNQLPQKKAIS